MICLLASSGSTLVVGDHTGQCHVLEVRSGGFAPGILRSAIRVDSIQQVRTAISDLAVPVQRTVQLGSTVLRVAYAERQWFLIDAPRPS